MSRAGQPGRPEKGGMAIHDASSHYAQIFLDLRWTVI